MIEIPKAPMPEMVDVPDLGPNPSWANNEELKQLNQTMTKALEQLTRIQGWLVKIESNTRKSGFAP